jgi:uncharacterized LabA/DUF88 family protein
MSQTVLFIDGENFRHKIEDGFRGKSSEINLDKLFSKPLEGLALERKIFYAARLKIHQDSTKKSKELIDTQRRLKNNLENQGYEFVIAGNVRPQIVRAGKEKTVVFKEKGVDVRIAVDLVSLACEKKLKTAILCSSDSDLQPAVAELKKRDVEVIYLGFENSPNKGLTFTANRTILIRNSEIDKSFGK